MAGFEQWLYVYSKDSTVLYQDEQQSTYWDSVTVSDVLGYPWNDGSVTALSDTAGGQPLDGNTILSTLSVVDNIYLYDVTPAQKIKNIYKGNIEIEKIYKGNIEIEKIYKGKILVRPVEAPSGPIELCFTANTANSTIQLTKNGTPTAVTLETSTDGSNWTTYTFGDTITLSNIGDKVYWRNTSTTDTGFSTDGDNYYQFVMSGSISASGDVTYLLNKNGTNTLSSNCFSYLFRDCASLTTSPSLPATILASYCYAYMFWGCTSLVNAPELPATTLAYSCYSSMFQDCTSLTTASSLQATTLAQACYSTMFYQCASLTTLPNLPATTLPDICYPGMFEGCSNIKLSTTQTGEYQTEYRIPTTGTGTTGNNSLINMFKSTGGTFTGTPSINTTYYTSNTVV